MEIAARGAARLMIGLHDATAAFRAFGYQQFLAHQGIRWSDCSRAGGAVAPCTQVGVVFDLTDDEHTEVCLSVSVWLREDSFVVQADATVDEPLPRPGGAGNQRTLLDLPDIKTHSLEECLAAVRTYTARLCSYPSVLDELGVPATHPEP